RLRPSGLLGRLPQIPAVQRAPSRPMLVALRRHALRLVPDGAAPRLRLEARMDAAEECVVQVYWGVRGESVAPQAPAALPALLFTAAAEARMTLPRGRDVLVQPNLPIDYRTT